MTDPRPASVLRRLEIDATPDPTFASALFAVLERQAGAARRRDASLPGRASRAIARSMAGAAAAAPAPVRRVSPRWAIVVALLVVASLVALWVGTNQPAHPRPFGFSTHILSTTVDGPPINVLNAGYADVVSPDGTWSAAVGGNLGTADPNVVIVRNVLTGDERTLHAGQSPERPEWSAGDDLAWIEGYTGDIVEPAVRVLVPGASDAGTWRVPDGQPVIDIAWSPNGGTLAIATVRIACSGSAESRLYLLDTRTMTAREIPLGNQAIRDLSWSPDGRWISGGIGANGMCGDENVSALSAIDVATGAITTLTGTDAVDSWAGGLWTPDSAWLVVQDPGSTTPDGVVSEVHPDGSGRHVLGRPAAADASLESISPDGNWLALVGPSATPYPSYSPDPSLEPSQQGPSGGVTSLYVMSASGGPATFVSDGVWDTRFTGWSPDGQWLVFVRGPVVDQGHYVTAEQAVTVWACHPGGSDLVELATAPAPWQAMPSATSAPAAP